MQVPPFVSIHRFAVPGGGATLLTVTVATFEVVELPRRPAPVR